MDVKPPQKRVKQQQQCEQHDDDEQQKRLGDALDADLLGVCISFLDYMSLVTCQSVSKEWHRILQYPLVWEQFYATMWRPKCSAPLPPGYRRALLPHFKDVCAARMASQCALSTRARSWVRDNGNVFVYNDAMYLRTFCMGGIESIHTESIRTESIRTESTLRPLASARALGVNVCYFEASILGCGSVGIASISTTAERVAYGFGSQSHLGWFPVSYGYHGDDGLLYWNDCKMRIVGGAQRAYGPSWGDATSLRRRQAAASVTIGCGFCLDTRQLFYTLDGRFLGLAPVTIKPSCAFAAAVSLHQIGDSVEINFGCSAFKFDIDAYIWESARADSGARAFGHSVRAA
uniref:F-box domain-containing protein n=1 Tax=Globisporangium ultimum (strain ATCC 200006 / CBS 805.95 / DAOM BR144) TaxID=431595 RepID=K3WMB1_GLOUD